MEPAAQESLRRKQGTVAICFHALANSKKNLALLRTSTWLQRLKSKIITRYKKRTTSWPRSLSKALGLRRADGPAAESGLRAKEPG